MNDLKQTTYAFYKKQLGARYPEKDIRDYVDGAFKRMSKDEAFKKAIWAVVRGDTTSQKVLSAIEQRGYTALVDWFDKGDMSEAPLILINPKNVVGVQGIEKVTEYEKMAALRRVSRAIGHPSKDLALQVLAQMGMMKR